MTRLRDAEQGQHSPPVWALVPELLEQLTGFLRRQYLVFTILFLCSLMLGGTYFLVTPAYYAATASLVIDSNRVRTLLQQQAASYLPMDTAQIETQVEILKSEDIALSVINTLHLTDSPEFAERPRGLVGLLLSIAQPVTSEKGNETEQIRNSLRTFLAGRTITRLGRTYFIEISYRSANPEIAAKIANAIAESYIASQLDVKFEATRRANAWLHDQIAELKAQSLAAERAVLDYKEKNNIVDVRELGGVGRIGTGRLIGEQQLAELNTQLVSARVATSEARARLDRINEVLTKDVREASVPDALKNEVINRLRNQYLDYAAREANVSSRYGEDHLAAVTLRGQMSDLQASIRDELGRIAASANNEYEIAKARERSLEQSLQDLISEGKTTKRDRIGLSELEIGAAAYRTIYENFLQHYTESIQQQSFPIGEARIVTRATPPTEKSGPSAMRILTLAGALGLVMGTGVALVREAVDFVFRTARQVEKALHAPCLSVLPDLTVDAPGGLSTASDQAAGESGPKPKALPGSIVQEHERATGDQAPALAFTDPFMRRVVDDPLSSFAEGIRCVKIAVELQAAIKASKVIGVTSTLKSEGKSTVACNLAQLMAHAGKRIILVDADLRKPTLVRCIEPQPTLGLLEVLNGREELAHAVRVDATTRLAVLPSLIDKDLIHTDAVVQSEQFRDLIARLRNDYDFIILDLPPLAPVVDVRATAQVIDAVVFVVEWGRTKIDTVTRYLDAAPEVSDRILGIVLNKARSDPHAAHEHYYGSEYRNRYYATG